VHLKGPIGGVSEGNEEMPEEGNEGQRKEGVMCVYNEGDGPACFRTRKNRKRERTQHRRGGDLFGRISENGRMYERA